jgi:hypothetical protein
VGLAAKAAQQEGFTAKTGVASRPKAFHRCDARPFDISLGVQFHRLPASVHTLPKFLVSADA